MRPNILSWTLLLMLLMLQGGRFSQALAATLPPSQSLAEALNPDGTLRPGTTGSFDAHHFRLRTAPDGRPVFRPAGTTGTGDERWQDGFGLPNGLDGTVYAVVCTGTDVYVGGFFHNTCTGAANNVAKWNGTTWSALGNGPANGVGGVSGVNNGVQALAVASNGDVYAGGYFATAGGVSANHVAKWNGTTWSALGAGATNGVDGSVTALTVASNGDVYVGGMFTTAGRIAANNVAKWNGTAWSSLGTGTANGVIGGGIWGPVSTLATAPNGDVYVGGGFTQAGGVAARFIARWNGTSWNTLGTGSTNGVFGIYAYGTVRTIAIAGNGDVYVGGLFEGAGGISVTNVAKWNGTVWSPLGAGSTNGLGHGSTDARHNGTVCSLAIAGNGDVYASGDFSLAGGVAANNVAKWDGVAWSPVGAGTNRIQASNIINALAVASNGDLYAGGAFTVTDGLTANNVSRWNGNNWNSIGSSSGNGVNDTIWAITVASNGDVYVGGGFTQAGGVAANNVAKWNGTTWSSLGTGTANGVSDGEVYALAIASNGDVYVGGLFSSAGGISVNNVAKWNGTAWSPLGAGTANGVNATPFGYVKALAIASNGDVYVGGNFSQAGGIAANGLAKWNGTTWSLLGTANRAVNALAIASNGDVYVCGSFTQASGLASYNVAKWNGTAWSPLGTSTIDGGTALAIASNGDVYVGGFISLAGGVAANGVAKWNGTAWSTLGTGVGANSIVVQLALVSNGEVYVGGAFSQMDGVAARCVVKWNGTAWNTLGTGTSGEATSVAIGLNNQVYVGGAFTTVGDGSKAMAHFGVYDPSAPLAVVASSGSAARATLFPNPAHSTVTLLLPPSAPRQAVLLTDAQGRLVRRYPAPTTETKLDIKGLSPGIYWIKCGQISERLLVE